MDAFSACLCYNTPTTAIELPEQGRGVFWSKLTRLRSPLDEVAASGKEGKTLADKFTRLGSLILDVLNIRGNTLTSNCIKWSLTFICYPVCRVSSYPRSSWSSEKRLAKGQLLPPMLASIPVMPSSFYPTKIPFICHSKLREHTLVDYH